MIRTLLIIFDIWLPLKHHIQKNPSTSTTKKKHHTHESLTTQNPQRFRTLQAHFPLVRIPNFSIVFRSRNDRASSITTATIKTLHRRQHHGRRDANLVRVLEKQQFRASDMAKTIRRGLPTIFDRLLSSDLRGSVTRPTFSLSDCSEAERVLSMVDPFKYLEIIVVPFKN